MSRALPAGLVGILAAEVLVCPLCRETLSAGADAARSLRCPKGHSFDVARQGHVQLFQGKKDEDTYDRRLMEARAQVLALGFFAGLEAWLAEHVRTELPEGARVLDAGCGEGTLLTRLCASTELQPRGWQGIGVDLASEGVRMAAARSKNEAWLVADLAKLPVRDGALQLVLNVLSPARYDEFRRVLDPRGRLVKAIPTENHLRQLREALGARDDYSNAGVAQGFEDAFPGAVRERLETTVPCGAASAEAFLAMTPLGWHATDEQRRRFVAEAPATITVSLDVLMNRLP